MDLYAYARIGDWSDLLPSTPPRPRGIRLMKIEISTNGELPTFDSFVGQDVIYVHTRCGECGGGEDSNYVSFGMDEWEESLGDLLLASEDESFDCTYRDTYMKVPEDKMELYNKFLEAFAKEVEEYEDVSTEEE